MHTFSLPQAMQRLAVDADTLDMLIDRGEIETMIVGDIQRVLARSMDIYEIQKQKQSDALDNMIALTEDLSLLGIY